MGPSKRMARDSEPAFLGCGSFGKQMKVKRVLQMKRWDGQWMFKVKVTGVLLDEEGVCCMRLVDDAAEFLYYIVGRPRL